MRSEFLFFLKVANSDLELEIPSLEPIEPAISHRSAGFVFIANDVNGVTVETRPIDAVGVDHQLVNITIGYAGIAQTMITWSTLERRLEVTLDELGLFTVLYAETDDEICLANREGLLELALKDRRLNSRAIRFFSVAGFLPPGWSFYDGSGRVGQRSSWVFGDRITARHEDSDWAPFSEPKSWSAPQILEVIKHALDDIHREIDPKELRLSGGVDTRLVSELWMHPILTTVVHSPWMKDGEDLDVNISQAWARQKNFEHQVLHPTSESFHFFSGDTARPFLTGLCGGEFLGGQFRRVIPSKPHEWIEGVQLEEELRENLWIKGVSADERTWNYESMRVFMQSAHSTIYNSKTGSWSTPYKLHQCAVSPFTTPRFIKACLSLPAQVVGDYELYEAVFRRLDARVMKVPLMSYMNERIPELRPGPEWGRDPKSELKPQPPRMTLERAVEVLCAICERKGVEIAEPQLKQLFRDPSLRTNVAALCHWAFPRFSSSL